MKTFEERYTAWIDGHLEGPALVAFEQELARRAAAGEAQADKTDAARLHLLLTGHLQAPALTNAEFFSHQLRERIEAERALARRREEARGSRGSLFGWPILRLATLGACCLFVAAALYYGMMPSRNSGSKSPDIAKSDPEVVPTDTQPEPNVAMDATPPPVPVNPSRNGTSGTATVAMRSPMPATLEAASDDLQAHVPDGSQNPTTATPLRYKDPSVNVLWLDGLDYLPNVPGDDARPAATPATAPAVSPATAAPNTAP